jgi:hypothetical protein
MQELEESQRGGIFETIVLRFDKKIDWRNKKQNIIKVQ